MSAGQEMRVDQLRAGLVLANDVFDAHGHMLICHGSVLTDVLIRLFAARNIAIVTVEAADSETLQAEALAKQQLAEKALRHRFRQLESDPQAQCLLQVLLDYFTGGSSHGPNKSG